MNPISKHLDKKNLHHAYLIEGARDEVVPAILEFLKDSEMEIAHNSDLVHINLDSFRIEDARNLKSYGAERSFSAGKKVFIISANNFLLEAQNSLLKMFEEPIENTHFFLIVPDTNALLPTFISRFYLISPTRGVGEEAKEVEKFIALPMRDRIEFVKNLLTEEGGEDEEGNAPTKVGVPTGVGKDLSIDSTRAKALKFLNALEFVLHSKFLKNFSGVTPPSAWTLTDNNFPKTCYEHFFKVREFLRMPGFSAKSLMESVALIVPIF